MHGCAQWLVEPSGKEISRYNEARRRRSTIDRVLIAAILASTGWAVWLIIDLLWGKR